MSDPSSEIERINALTNNARNTWFALLAALVFVGVTLLSVKPIDFYGVGRATDLPLVGVSVPTNFFFYVAPILTVAIYGYFHLYLIRLWDALSVAPARINGLKLGSAIAPWLIVDSALFLRRFLRDDCTDPRALDIPSVFWNIIFAWVAGPAVLIYLWIQSLPARDTVMSGIAAGMIIFSLIFFMGSGVMLVRRMRAAPESTPRDLLDVAIITGFIWVALSMIVATQTWHRTHPTGNNPAPLTLTGEQITQRPDGWLPYEIASDEFRDAWCSRKGIENCSELSDENLRVFENAWDARRAASIADMRRPGWQSNDLWKPNLSFANLARAFMPGMDLSGLDFVETDFSNANLEQSDLGCALFSERECIQEPQLVNARFVMALMDNSRLSHALIEDSRFSGAKATGADFSNTKISRTFFDCHNSLNLPSLFCEFSTHLTGSDFQNSEIDSSFFNGVQMQDANLSWTIIRGTDFGCGEEDLRNCSAPTNLDRVNLSWATIESSSFEAATLHAANLKYATIADTHLFQTHLPNADLKGVNIKDSTLHFTNLNSASIGCKSLHDIECHQNTRISKTDMKWARLQNASLIRAVLHDVDLKGTHLNNTNLSLSHISGLSPLDDQLKNTNFRGALNRGGAIKNLDAASIIWDRNTDFRNVLIDGSVNVSPHFRAKMGQPCQWLKDDVSDSEFNSIWIWWVGRVINASPERVSEILGINAPPASTALLKKYKLANCEPQTGPFPTGK